MKNNTTEDFFDVGLELLAVGGAKAVTIEALCERLEVTKGSFYHHFRSGPAFMTALLAHWELEFGRRLAEQADAISDPVERLTTLKSFAVDHVHHEAESAIRAMARTDGAAAAIQRRLDRGRAAVIAATLVELGVEADYADDLGHLGLAILVGAQHTGDRVDRARLGRMFDEYERFLVSAIPATRPST